MTSFRYFTKLTTADNNHFSSDLLKRCNSGVLELVQILVVLSVDLFLYFSHKKKSRLPFPSSEIFQPVVQLCCEQLSNIYWATVHFHGKEAIALHFFGKHFIETNKILHHAFQPLLWKPLYVLRHRYF